MLLMVVAAMPEKRWVLEVLSAHEASLLRYATTIVGPEQAKDVVQDTFLELCRADRDELSGHLVPWLFTVCRNRALSLKRKEIRHADEEEVMGIASVEVGPHVELEQKEAGETIAALLDQLPARTREVVNLKFAGGLSYKEIADVTGLTVSHVGVILHEALGKVRERFLKKERELALVGRTS